MNKRHNTRQGIFYGMILLVIGVFCFLYWAQKKEVWFCDEVYSFESANGFEQAWPATYVDQWMSGEDVERFFAADSDKLSLKEISVRLYSDHVPLYFWIFRMVSFWGFHGSGTVWIGLIINLVFYIGVLGIIYLLFWKLTKSPLYAVFMVLASTVINRLMLQQSTTIRMYMMLLFEELVLVLAAVWIQHVKNKDKLSAVGFIALYLVGLAGFLTHYDFWIFYAATAIVFCGWLFFEALKSKHFFRGIQFKAMVAWGICFVFSLGTTIMLFPYCRWNLNRGKGETALQSLFVFSKEKLKNIVWGYERQSIAVFGENIPVWLGLFVLFGCLVGGACVLYTRKEYHKLTYLTLVGLTCQIYQLVVCFTFPAAKEERYLWGSFSIIVWLACYGAYLLLHVLGTYLKAVKREKLTEGIVLGVLMLCFIGTQINTIDGGKGIAYLFHENKDMDLLESYAEIPWIVYGEVMDAYSYYDILIPEEICFVTEKDTKEGRKAIAQMPETNQFVLYTTEKYYEQSLEFLEKSLGKEISAQELLQSVNLKAYLVNVD